MQQAIDILDEMIKDIEKLYPIDGLLKATSTRGSLESLQEAKSRVQALGDGWISVTERLPSVGGTYLVYYGDSVYDCNFEDNRFVIYNDGYKYFQNVTHWMPLPLPPKQ